MYKSRTYIQISYIKQLQMLKDSSNLRQADSRMTSQYKSESFRTDIAIDPRIQPYEVPIQDNIRETANRKIAYEQFPRTNNYDNQNIWTSNASYQSQMGYPYQNKGFILTNNKIMTSIRNSGNIIIPTPPIVNEQALRNSRSNPNPHIYDSNHLYGVGLVGKGLKRSDVRKKLGDIMGYSGFSPAVELRHK